MKLKSTNLYIFCKDYIFGGGVTIGVYAHTHEDAKKVITEYSVIDEFENVSYPFKNIENSFAEYPLKGINEVTGISFIREYI